MKKLLLTLFVIVGISGVIAAMTYKPTTSSSSTKTTTQITAGVTPKATATTVPTVTVSKSVVATPTPTATPTTSISTSGYTDGSYTASSSNRYGTVSIKVTISSGKISKVDLVDMPGDHHESQEISDYSGPVLVKETIVAQSADIDYVSGATLTSNSYVQALQKVLNEAQS